MVDRCFRSSSFYAGPLAIAAVAVLFASCGDITGGTVGPVELVVGIDSPATGEHFLVGEEVRLIGAATEREVPLDGSALTWHSSINGNLGTGTVLTRDDLAEGRHTIRLSATRSDTTASDSIEIVVLGEGGTLAFKAHPWVSGIPIIAFSSSSSGPTLPLPSSRQIRWSHISHQPRAPVGLVSHMPS